ncbi:hypothetical protein [Kiloniella laminariae]|nr:hypothetical protein [Kiloniella laminariae]
MTDLSLINIPVISAVSEPDGSYERPVLRLANDFWPVWTQKRNSYD